MTAAVQSGSTHAAGENSTTANNAYSFTFLAALAGEHITQIQIDLTGIGTFDQSGNDGRDFVVGSASDVTPLPVPDVDGPVLTINFSAGEFTQGDTLRFGIDADGDVEVGGDFGTQSVPIKVTFSDGSSTTISEGDYESGPGSTSVASLSDATKLIGGDGNDVLIGSDGNNTLVGGDGEDVLAGGLGVDMLWGGDEGGTGDGDTDTFVIDDLTAADIIGDFEAGIDEVDLTALLTLPGGTDVETGGTSGYVDYDSGNW